MKHCDSVRAPLSPDADAVGLSVVVPESSSEKAVFCTAVTHALREWIRADCFLNIVQGRSVSNASRFRFGLEARRC